MTPTRRSVLVTAAAAVALAAYAADRPRPIVIAHRGASGERPEHTLSAYRLAIAQGCDFIEPDLVVTKDGHLVARHENEISGTTDVAAHPAFATRRTVKQIDGEAVQGWFVEDFTLSELKTLRARERLPELRPKSARYDGQDAIPTFQEVVDLAKAESARTGRVIGVYPEMKHPSFLAGLGVPIEPRLAEALKANGLDARDAPVFVQSFEAESLKRFKALSRARRVQLVSADQTSRGMVADSERLQAVAAYADGVGPDWSLVIPPALDGGLGPKSSLVAEAHAAGLVVHPWTVRAENRYLPPRLRRGADPAAHGHVDVVFAALFDAGVDGVFSDFPAMAVKARR